MSKVKILQGDTSFDEIYRIIDIDDDLDIYCKIKNKNEEKSISLELI